MTLTYPSPNELGLPEKYSSWRPGQELALDTALDWLASDTRFLALCCPTGAGKSLIYMALAKAAGRVAILTSTKGLQDQLLTDFREAGLVDIRGMNNYECVAANKSDFPFFTNKGERVPCDEGPCMGGFRCELSQAGCTYFDARRLATRSELVVSNYSYWLRVQNGEERAGLGQFALLILDEAHNSPDELSDYLSVEFGASELQELLNEDFPADSEDWEAWRGWARARKSKCDGMIESERQSQNATRAQIRYIKSLSNLRDRLTAISQAKGDWVQESYRDGRGSRKLKFDPVNVKEYARALWSDIPHVLMVSATVRPKTMGLFGLSEATNDSPREETAGDQPLDPGVETGEGRDFDSSTGGGRSFVFYESSQAFSPRRRPVFYIPTVKMHHGMSWDQMKWWVNRIDGIIGGRLDRKGIVHTTSYKRARFLAEHSQYADRLLVPEGFNTKSVVERFKSLSSRSGVVLVSPAITTGYDFPGDQCRYQIIGKIPFPDTRSKITQAREKLDKDYGPYQAMQTIVQSAGRGMRSADDWCETFIIDDQWKWFNAAYRSFQPQWFRAAIRYSGTVPPALTL